MPRNRVRDKAFPVGLFIIFSIAILTGGILWLNNFSMQPHYTFKVAFTHPEKIIVGLPIFYRGVQVGRVMDVGLSKDYKHTLVQIGITENPLPIPTDSQVKIREEGFTGQRFVDIVPPENESSNTHMVAEGDVINGTDPYGWSEIEEELGSLSKHHEIEKTIMLTQATMKDLDTTSKNLRAFTANGNRFFGDFNGVTGSARETFRQLNAMAQQLQLAAADVQNVSHEAKGTLNNTLPQMATALQGINSKVTNAPAALDSVAEAANQAQKTLSTINTELVQSNLIPTMSQTLQRLDLNGTGSSSGLTLPPVLGTSPLAPSIMSTAPIQLNPPPPTPKHIGTLQQVRVTFNHVDCLANQLNALLNKRFLGVRLFLGKPGGGYDCQVPLQPLEE